MEFLASTAESTLHLACTPSWKALKDMARFSELCYLSGNVQRDAANSPRASTRRNAANSARSYAIFNTPQATSGATIAPAANIAPVIDGLMAAARLRGTAVKLAAAGRSAGVTTDITNAPRAGTSICDSRLLASRQPSATSRLVASAAPMRKRLDGMCVNTM